MIMKDLSVQTNVTTQTKPSNLKTLGFTLVVAGNPFDIFSKRHLPSNQIGEHSNLERKSSAICSTA